MAPPVAAIRDGGFHRLLPAAVMYRVQAQPSRSAMAVGELSECCMCVFSGVGGNPMSNMVYLDDGEDDGGVCFELPPPADFLSCCCLCRKKLHGLDIFMYRGEKAFCSVECRYQQILSDEQKKQDSKAVKPPKFSVSPPFFLASVVAA